MRNTQPRFGLLHKAIVLVTRALATEPKVEIRIEISNGIRSWVLAG
jgi:hypothetical protein